MVRIFDEQPGTKENESVVVEELDGADAEIEFFAAMKAQNSEQGLNLHNRTDSELGSLALFRGVVVSEIPDLHAACNIIDFEQNQNLISADQINKNIYYLLEGEVNISTDENRNNIIGKIEQGQSIGIRSAIDGRPSTACFFTTRPSRVVEIEYEKLCGVIDQSHQLTCNLIFELSGCIKGENYTPVESPEVKITNEAPFQENVLDIDTLTGLPNHNWLVKTLPEKLTLSRINENYLALLVFEIKELEDIEKQFGKEAEVSVIQSFKNAIKENLAENDILVRDDHNIFIVICADAKCKEESENFISRIDFAVYGMNLSLPDGRLLPKVSVNSSVLVQNEEQTADQVIEKARQVCIRQSASISNLGASGFKSNP